MKNVLQSIGAVAVLAMSAGTANAFHCNCCPDCGKKVCIATPEEITVDRHCYKVECKEICIPKYQLPWKKCCKPQCGRARTINVLKKVDYECKACGCKWEAVCVVPTCGGASACDCQSTAQSCDVGPISTENGDHEPYYPEYYHDDMPAAPIIAPDSPVDVPEPPAVRATCLPAASKQAKSNAANRHQPNFGGLFELVGEGISDRR